MSADNRTRPPDAAVEYFDALAHDVLRAWRYFSASGDAPATVAALLVVAWAILLAVLRRERG